MTEVLDLPVVRAVSKAYVQHEVWLAGIGAGGVLGKVHPEPHPHAGHGADTEAVAEVLLRGTTRNAWWDAKMYAHGLDSFMQLSFDEGRRLVDEWMDEWPYVTRSEMMKTVNVLKRAMGLGLIVGEKFYGRWCWRPV